MDLATDLKNMAIARNEMHELGLKIKSCLMGRATKQTGIPHVFISSNKGLEAIYTENQK